MKSVLRVLSFGALLAGVQQHGAHAAHLGDDRQHSRPRRRLEPNANIAAIIEDEISKGVKHPRFTLTATADSTASQQSGLRRSLNSETEEELFEVHVVLTDPSVTDATSISINGGESKPANSTTKFLVADHHADVSESSSTFVILAVDEENGSVKGIVQKDDQLVKWVQESGETAVVSDASYDPPQDWTCTVDEVTLDGETSRHLKNREDSHGHDHSHNHGHSSHSHNHFNLGNFAEQLGIEKMNLRSQRRRIYATDDFPSSHSYQVDMYIEVDTAMVNHHDPTDAVYMPNTVNYINALITGKCLIHILWTMPASITSLISYYCTSTSVSKQFRQSICGKWILNVSGILLRHFSLSYT